VFYPGQGASKRKYLSERQVGKMKFVRTTDPEISVYLIPWFIGSPVEIGLELHRRMTQTPDDTCVLLAMKDNYIKALLIGYMEDGDLFVWQAHKSKDMDRPRLMFHELCVWGRSRGAKKARLISPDKRARRMYRKKYGFHNIGETEMEREI
jgi:hypothetical protein